MGFFSEIRAGVEDARVQIRAEAEAQIAETARIVQNTSDLAQLKRASYEDNPTIRLAVAQNPHTPDWLLRTMVRDRDYQVAAAVNQRLASHAPQTTNYSQPTRYAAAPSTSQPARQAPQQVWCHNCGNSVVFDSRFCDHCGTALAGAAAQPAPAPAPQTAPAQSTQTAPANPAPAHSQPGHYVGTNVRSDRPQTANEPIWTYCEDEGHTLLPGTATCPECGSPAEVDPQGRPYPPGVLEGSKQDAAHEYEGDDLAPPPAESSAIPTVSDAPVKASLKIVIDPDTYQGGEEDYEVGFTVPGSLHVTGIAIQLAQNPDTGLEFGRMYTMQLWNPSTRQWQRISPLNPVGDPRVLNAPVVSFVNVNDAERIEIMNNMMS